MDCGRFIRGRVCTGRTIGKKLNRQPFPENLRIRQRHSTFSAIPIMHYLTGFLLLLAVTFIKTSSFAQTSKVISGSTNFSVKFILGTCNGTFDAPKGSVVFSEKDLENASFNLTIAANTFNTNNDTRDKDMKSEKYFYASKYPEIHFKSSRVEKIKGQYQTTGTLTIRDVSKIVTLPFQAQKNTDGGYQLSSSFEVNRLDYNLGKKDWKLKDVVTVSLKAVIR